MRQPASSPAAVQLPTSTVSRYPMPQFSPDILCYQTRAQRCLACTVDAGEYDVARLHQYTPSAISSRLYTLG